jgi:hypothetical protein
MKALKTCVLAAVLLSAFAIVLAGCGVGGAMRT